MDSPNTAANIGRSQPANGGVSTNAQGKNAGNMASAAYQNKRGPAGAEGFGKPRGSGQGQAGALIMAAQQQQLSPAVNNSHQSQEGIASRQAAAGQATMPGTHAGSVMLDKGDLAQELREGGIRPPPHHGNQQRLQRGNVASNSGSKALGDEQLVRTTSHSPFQAGRATATNFNRGGGGINQQMLGAIGDGVPNQSSNKSIPTTLGLAGRQGGGIDLGKLQQLKAAKNQPPKIDYLSNMNAAQGAGLAAAAANMNRASLISADASNLVNNPRQNKYQLDRGLADKDGQRQTSLNRNDATRESLQSRLERSSNRLVERIHTRLVNQQHGGAGQKKQGQLQSIQSSQSKPLAAGQAPSEAHARNLVSKTGVTVTRSASGELGPDDTDPAPATSSVEAKVTRSRQSGLKKHSSKRAGDKIKDSVDTKAAQQMLRGAGGQTESMATSPVGTVDPYHMGADIQTGARHGRLVKLTKSMQNTIFGDERNVASRTPGSQQQDATSSAQGARSRGANATDDKSTERLPQQVGAGKHSRGAVAEQTTAAADSAHGASGSATDGAGRKGKEASEINTERRNNQATLNTTGTVSGGAPDSQVRESADTSQKENKNPKFRSADSSSPLTNVRHGQGSSPFGDNAQPFAEGGEVAAHAQRDSVLNQDVEEGIQADDEDNDQIETERNSNPAQKRQAELQRILQQKADGASRQPGLPPGGAQDGQATPGDGRSSREPRGDVLYQIKESYEGMSCSALVSSEGGEQSNASFCNASGQQLGASGSLPLRAVPHDFDVAKLSRGGPVNGGGMHPHPTMPDKLVTASGAVITRPKSKQQSKKHRQQQAAAQNSGSHPHSKFSELRKLQSQNTRSNKAIDVLKSVNQAEIAAQQQAQLEEQVLANVQYQQTAAAMKNSFNFVQEEQENEDMGSDGRENAAERRPNAAGVDPTSPTDSKENSTKRPTHAKKQSAIKSYGDIANQLLSTSPKNAGEGPQADGNAPPHGDAPLTSGPTSHRGMAMAGSAGTSPLNLQNMASKGKPYQASQDHVDQQQFQQDQMNSPLHQGAPAQPKNYPAGAAAGRQQNPFQDNSLSQSQEHHPAMRQQQNPGQHPPGLANNKSKQRHKIEQNGLSGAAYMKKFAVTSNNFYMTTNNEQLPQPNQRDQSGSLNTRQPPLGKYSKSPTTLQYHNNGPPQQQYHQQMLGTAGTSFHQQNPQHVYHKQQYGNQKFYGRGTGTATGNTHSAYANNTVYGAGFGARGTLARAGNSSGERESSLSAFKNQQSSGQGGFGQGNVFGGDPRGATVSGNAAAAYNDQQHYNGVLDQLGQAGTVNSGSQLRGGNHSLGRNTFYVSDYQLQKQSREFNNQSMGRRQKKLYNGGSNGVMGDVSTAQGSYNLGNAQQPAAGHLQHRGETAPKAHGFIKPRAISRQADTHIRIEVHKDQRIVHHLQHDKQENMNLMFYNFNDFNNAYAGPNGRRPTAGGAGDGGRRANMLGNGPGFGGPQTQGGMRTQNNFYKSKGLLEGQGAIKEQAHPQNSSDRKPNVGGNIHEAPVRPNCGDRIPTRERQYRSAHQNVRRRDITRQQYHQLQMQQAQAQAQQQAQLQAQQQMSQPMPPT